MSDTLTPSTVVVRAPGFITSKMDGEYLTMSVEKGTYYAMREVAARIWELLEEPHPIAEICRQLQTEFNVSAETCETEVFSFLTQLNTNNMLEVG